MKKRKNPTTIQEKVMRVATVARHFDLMAGEALEEMMHRRHLASWALDLSAHISNRSEITEPEREQDDPAEN